MLDFLKDNIGVITPVIVFLVGWLLPPLRFNTIGLKLRNNVGKDIAKVAAERLDALEKGLLGQDVNGNSDLISNDQLKVEVNKMRIDLGLKE